MGRVQYLIHKVGVGPVGRQNLEAEEAEEIYRLLFEGTLTPTQVGAFLIAMRIKDETVDEIATCTKIAREHFPPFEAPLDGPAVDLPACAGKRATFPIGLPAAFVAAGAGVKVFHHGEVELNRIGPAEVLAALGLEYRLSLEATQAVFSDCGIAFAYYPTYYPFFSYLLRLKEEMGVRSVFYTVARLIDPANTRHCLGGIAHPVHLEELCQVGQKLGMERVLIFQGLEGETEISAAKDTRMAELKDGKIESFRLDPKSLGLKRSSRDELGGFDANEAAQILINALQGKENAPRTEIILLNAAALIYIAAAADSWESALALAEESIKSGKAYAVFERFRACVGSVRQAVEVGYRP